MAVPRRRSAAASRIVRFLLLFFAFNSLFLLYFFFHHQHPDNDRRNVAPPPAPRQLSVLKPWPHLPSLLPWTSLSNPNPKPRSCEGYFGNGFTRRVDVRRRPVVGGGGWFRCSYSETLRSSVCEGGGVKMDPSRIVMSRGGETLEGVMGRGEEEELPRFEEGAFEIDGGTGSDRVSGERLVSKGFLEEYMPKGAIGRHTMRELVAGIRVAGELECEQWIENPTLLVTRFEYANLFHTMTDWYSAYVSSRISNLSNRPDVFFVDGHCKAPLEQTWEAMFSSFRYAKNFTGPVCFRHVILSPLGYETAMFKGLSESFSCHGTAASVLQDNPDDHKTARLTEFGEMLRAVFDLPVDDRDIQKPTTGHNVLFVRREDYLAHPRHSGKIESRLSNEQGVFDALKSWIDGYTNCKINLVNGLFGHMPFKDQLRAIQEASVVIGAHGAGLTHLVSARSDTVVLEIISSSYRRPHFRLISEWKGLTYHAINLGGSYAEPNVVVNKLRGIMQDLGC